MMKRIRGKLVWIALLLALGGAIAYGFRPQPVAVDTAIVTRGSLKISVDDDGETRIREKFVVSAPVSGKMLRIQLREGDNVIVGETELAQIKPLAPALLDVRTRAEAEARVRAAQAAMQQSDAATLRSREALRLAEQHLERAERLREQKAISNSDFDAFQSRERMAFAELRSNEFAARVATYELDQTEAALRYAQPGEGQMPDETTFRIRSPIDGRVLKVMQEHTAVVSAGMPIVELGDPREMEMTVDVLSVDAVRIRSGNRVVIDHWGGDRTLAGTVRLVEPSAFLKISALGVEEKRVNVIIDFDAPWPQRQALGDGYRVEASIIVDQTDASSLKVPAGSLFHQNGQWYVFAIQGNIARQRPVTVGLSNGRETEIIEGVDESQQLILHPPDTVVDGSSVSPI